MPAIGLIDEREEQIPWDRVLVGTGSFTFPRPFLAAVARTTERKEYADISASYNGLIRQMLLKRRHDYYVRPGEQFYVAFGKAVHLLLETYASDMLGERTETPLTVVRTVPGANGRKTTVKFGGQPDEYKVTAGVLRLLDVKVTGLYKVKKILENGVEAEAPDWVTQLNRYRWLLQNAPGSPVLGKTSMALMEIFNVARDWREFESKKEDGYPNWGEVWQVPEILDAVVLAGIDAACSDFACHKDTPDNELPECPKDMLWRGTRCKRYCEVNGFCSQYAVARKRSKKRAGGW